MKFQIGMEELAMLLFSFMLYSWCTDRSFWIYAALFLAPDISFVAYAINPRIGAIAYNLLHHKGLALLLFAVGYFLHWEWGMIIGSVFFGHSSFDRMLGYGLKYPDSFQNTHLGRIGKG